MAITPEQLQQRFPQLLGKLDHKELQVLLDNLARIEVAPGTEVVRAEDHSDSLYLIWEGKVAFFTEVAGKEIALGALGPGRFFGTEVVIEPTAEVGTSRTMEPSVLLRLDHASLEKLGESRPRLASHLLRALSLDMVDWLRSVEKYMTERTLPNDIEESVRMVRELRGLEEV